MAQGKKFTDMVGKQFVNNHGDVGIIIEYINAHNVKVKTDNDYMFKAELKHLQAGSWKTPYSKTAYHIGYSGVGKYKKSDSYGNNTPEYQSWFGMLTRVYNKKYKELKPTYDGCSVCEEWLNFQNFAEWYNENKWNCGSHRLAVDKDILIKGNKLYSPNNCILVPLEINSIFTKAVALRDDNLPIGVSIRNGKYICRLSTKLITQRNFSKTFDTVEEAFNCYKQTKEQYIKDVADLYKSTYLEFPQKLYDAMYSYKVEITD